MNAKRYSGSSKPLGQSHTRANTGASILLALFFILFCGVVAIIVLRFAAVNGERTAEHAREENTYYAVVSAEGLVEDTLQSSIIGSSAPFTLQSTDGAVWADPGLSSSPTSMDDQIKAWLYQQACIVQAGTAASDAKDLTLNISATDGKGTAYPADGITVDVIFSMDPANYDVTISAAVHQESSSSNRNYYAYTLTRTVKATDDRSGNPEVLSWSLEEGTA